MVLSLQGLISTRIHTFPWVVLVAFKASVEPRCIFLFLFLNIQMSVQTRHLLHDIIYHIFMGWNSFPNHSSPLGLGLLWDSVPGLEADI